jgi:hypothetical protein
MGNGHEWWNLKKERDSKAWLYNNRAFFGWKEWLSTIMYDMNKLGI